jgi:predicted nucleic acid-binding Zn ribbon protein
MMRFRSPQKMADVLGELMARRGYARVQASEDLHRAWRTAAGDAAGPYTKVGAVRGGVLEVFVSNSTMLHELTFQKAGLLAALSRSLPEQRLRGLRFRLAAVEKD